MMRRDHPALSLSRQCAVLSISRSSFYYAPMGESPETLALMRRIDELFMKYPFYGSRQMARQLRREGVRVGRHRIHRVRRENDSLDHFLILLTPSDGPGGHLPSAENRRAAPGAQDLSLSAQGAGDRPAQPGLVCRHHPGSGSGAGSTYPSSAASCTWSRSWIGRRATFCPGGCPIVSLVAPLVRATMANGRRVLRRGTGGGAGSLRPVGDHEYRPGIADHWLGLDHDADRCRRTGVNGRPGPINGQYLH